MVGKKALIVLKFVLKIRHFLLVSVWGGKQVGVVYLDFLGFLVILGFQVVQVVQGFLVVLAKLGILCIILFRFATIFRQIQVHHKRRKIGGLR